MITNEKVIELVQRTRDVATLALERGAYRLSDSEMLTSPLVAAVFTVLAEEEREGAQVTEGPALIGYAVDDEESE